MHFFLRVNDDDTNFLGTNGWLAVVVMAALDRDEKATGMVVSRLVVVV